MGEVIRIKPHHFLDIVRDFGAGVEFEPSPYGHALHLVAEKVLADRQTMLKLVLSIDRICEPCKNHVDGHCVDTTATTGEVTSKEQWNLTIDTRLLQRLGLEEGTRIRADDFCRLTRERLYPAGQVEGALIFDIWREAPREKTESRARDLLRGIALYLGESTPALP